MVKINEESFGKRKPKTVLLNTGFIKGGIEALNVKIKNEVGQKR